jgi:hypothetical protein
MKEKKKASMSGRRGSTCICRLLHLAQSSLMCLENVDTVELGTAKVIVSWIRKVQQLPK